MVVPGHRYHATPGRGARHIGVLEHVRAAVHARALAVPDAKHAVVFIHPRRRKPELLRAPQGGGGQLFIDTGLEHHVVFLQMLLRLLQRLVVIAQGRAAVAADKAGRVFACGEVAHALQHGQAHQGLHAAHEGGAGAQGVFVVQAEGVGRGPQLGRVQWGVHGQKSPEGGGAALWAAGSAATSG